MLCHLGVLAMTCSDVERKPLPASQSETHSEEWLVLQHQFLGGIWDSLNLLSALYYCGVRIQLAPIYGKGKCPVKQFGTLLLASTNLSVLCPNHMLNTTEANNHEKMVKVWQWEAIHDVKVCV